MSQTIKVGVRLRPLLTHEKGQQPCLAVNGNDVSVIPGSVSDGYPESIWRFDHAMDSSEASGPNHVDNYGVYNMIGRSIVEHALEGFNACLFCYGQTGTGKTATIFGDKQAGPGFLILMLKDLFEQKSKEESQGNSMQVSVQMLEVYNEKVFDLLQETPSKIELHVLPVSVYIKGAELKLVETVDECLRVIDGGFSRKHTAATAMNPESSRGHTIIKLVIERFQNDEGIHLNSEIYFADLAGHENEKITKVTGEQLIELSYINKSLMWLESALHALATRHAQARHIVRHMHDMSLFRNSKLTLILSNALLGNSLAFVIVTLSPAVDHFSTSLSSLRFANEVKRIMVDVHSNAYVDPGTLIGRLEAEVKQLKEQLALATSSSPSAALEAEVKQLREQLALATSRASVASEVEGPQATERLAMISDPSDALEGEAREGRQLKEQLAMAVSDAAADEFRRPSVSLDEPGCQTNGGANDGTAAAAEGANQDEDILEPWSDWIRNLRQKMLPEVVLQTLHKNKRENDELRRQLDAIAGPRSRQKSFRAELQDRAASPLFPGSRRSISATSPQKSGMDSPRMVAPNSLLCSTSTQVVTGSASTYASTYAAGSASSYAASPTPSSQLRSISPQVVTRSTSAYLPPPSTSVLGTWTVACPVVADATDRSPVRMRSTLGPVDRSPVRMRSTISVPSKVANTVVADATNGSPLRMRSSPVQSQEFGASPAVMMLPLHTQVLQQVPGVASPSYGGSSYGGSVRL